MKKSIITLALIACAVMLFSCGNNGNKKSEKTQSEPAAAAASPKFEHVSDISGDNYVELVKTLCGVDPTPGDGMTLDKAYGSPGNANMKFKGAKGIEERDLQKLYFERCKAAADDGTVYTLVSDPVNGIQKGEAIPNFDNFKGVNWVYVYKGRIVNCAVSKYGSMKGLDTFELRFGR